jgi:hypothetical protein
MKDTPLVLICGLPQGNQMMIRIRFSFAQKNKPQFSFTHGFSRVIRSFKESGETV